MDLSTCRHETPFQLNYSSHSWGLPPQSVGYKPEGSGESSRRSERSEDLRSRDDAVRTHKGVCQNNLKSLCDLCELCASVVELRETLTTEAQSTLRMHREIRVSFSRQTSEECQKNRYPSWVRSNTLQLSGGLRYAPTAGYYLSRPCREDPPAYAGGSDMPDAFARPP